MDDLASHPAQANEMANPKPTEGSSVTKAFHEVLSSLSATNRPEPRYVSRVADTPLSQNSSTGLHVLATPDLLMPDERPSNIELPATPLVCDTGPVAELLGLAGRMNTEVNLGTTPLGAFCSLISPSIGDLKISLSRSFSTRAEGEAAVSTLALQLLKPTMPDNRPSHIQASESAPAPHPVPPSVPRLDRICTALNGEADWKQLLNKFIRRKNKNMEIEYNAHSAKLGPTRTTGWRSDVTLGPWKFSCYDYYGRLEAAERAAAKLAATQLWKAGHDIDIPRNVVRMLDLEGQGEAMKNLQLAQPVSEEQAFQPPPNQPHGTGETGNKTTFYRKPASKRRQPKIKKCPWTRENAVALGPRVIRDLTDIPEGREPKTFPESLDAITHICTTLQIDVPIFEVFPDEVGAKHCSGAAIFQPHPLISKARVGEVLHVFGIRRAKELCATGVLAFLEVVASDWAITSKPVGLHDAINLPRGRKRKVDEQEAQGGRGCKMQRLD